MKKCGRQRVNNSTLFSIIIFRILILSESENAERIENEHPSTAWAICYKFYMDDLLTGADLVEEGIEKRKIIHKTLGQYYFPLTKYASNSTELHKLIQSDLVEKAKVLVLQQDETVSILGLQWFSKEDCWGVKVDQS